MGKSKTEQHQEMIQNQLNHIYDEEDYGSSNGDYDDTLSFLENVFQDVDPVNFRELYTGKRSDMKVCLITCDGLVQSEIIDNHLLRPLMENKESLQRRTDVDVYLTNVFQVLSFKTTVQYEEMIQGIVYGETLVLLEGIDEALLFDTKGFETRSISEPEGEKIISGPREGFTEGLLANLTMLRRKLRTEKLKMKYLQFGKKTKTQVCISYLEGIAKPEILDELNRRLERIDIDGILDANYINELIRDDPWSPFRSMGYTERPDVVTAKLLEGRIALFIDGTPVVLTLPYLFIENFQSSEDYYLNFYYTTFCRALRILGFFLSIMVPAIYIAVVAYHQEMLPAPLLISIATERQSVPMPAAIEAFIMLIIFEILRETALRMQSNVGQALSIVGALVVGQAAVEAQLVAAPMIIVVALAGITSLLVPKMNAPTLLLRFGILLLASCLGFLGVTVGFAVSLAHILGLRSFGVWQFASDRRIDCQRAKDTIVRAPWHQMLFRPDQIAKNVVRQGRREDGL